MNTRLIRSAALAIALAVTGTVALAEGDIYSRLYEMHMADAKKAGMMSKQEFLAMVAKVWDMKAGEMKLKGGKMDAAQIKELEKTLGRTLMAHSGG